MKMWLIKVLGRRLKPNGVALDSTTFPTRRQWFAGAAGAAIGGTALAAEAALRPTSALAQTANFVDTTSNQTVGGIKTFTQPPVVPAGTFALTQVPGTAMVAANVTGPFAPASPGAAAPTRYVGGTSSGAPTTGTFVVGDFVIDQTAKVWICTVAGSPGTWAQQSGSGVDLTSDQTVGGVKTFTAPPVVPADAFPQAAVTGLAADLAAKAPAVGPFAPSTPGASAATRYVGGTAAGAPTTGTFTVGDFVIDQTAKVWICTVAGSPGTWAQQSGSGVDLTSNQTVGGVKTFTAPPVVPADAFPQAAVTGLVADLAAKQAAIPPGTYVVTASNLADLPNASTARSNLGLGTAATQSTAAFVAQVTGLDATGVTDATGPIQSVLDAAFTAGGGTVTLPVGVFKITNSLILKSGVHLRGAGRGVTILRGAAQVYAGVTVSGVVVYATVAMVGADRASVRHLTVDNATSGQRSNGIVLMPTGATYQGTICTNCVVEDNEVWMAAGANYLIWSLRADGVKIVRNWLDGAETRNNGSSSQEGIEIAGGTDVLVQGNTVKYIGNAGINCNTPAANTDKKALRVLDNYVSVARAGIVLVIGATSDLKAVNVEIGSNQVHDCWKSGITPQLTAGGTVVDVRIIRNSVVNCGTNGIFLSGSSATSAACIIAWNYIEGGQYGIRHSTWDGVRIVGNHVRNTSSWSVTTASGTDVSIENNTCEGAGVEAMYLASLTRSRVTNNHCSGYNTSNASSKAGIWLDACSQVLVMGNTFYRTTTEFYIVRVQNGDRIITLANMPMYTPKQRPFVLNGSTNANFGVLTASTGTSFTVFNTLVSGACRIIINQVDGTPVPVTVVPGTGQFVVTAATAFANQTFRWEIVLS
jgi:hypothetical protein